MAQESNRKKPAMAEIESADVTLPVYGETVPAKVVKLGMTSASEVFGDKAKDPNGQILMVFFAGEGIVGNQPLGFYKHPSPSSKLYIFVRKYGSPKVGMKVMVVRDEKGFWRLSL